MTAFTEAHAKLQKPRPKLLDTQEKKAHVNADDKIERGKCRQRSGGQCEVIERGRRCARRSSQNHHLIGGIGRRGRGKSRLHQHRLDVCDRCHKEITNHVLVTVNAIDREDAATVRYERTT